LKKIISAFVAFAFFTTNVFAQIPLVSAPFSPKIEQANLQGRSIEIPAELGKITSRSEGRGPLVIHISDAHANYDAQIAVKRILEHLVEKHAVRLIGLEGASGALHPEWFRLFSDKKLNSAVIDALVRDGQITGPELFAIENERKNAPQWAGVEDKNLYLSDLDAFRNTIKSYKAHKQVFDKLNTEIAAQKNRVFSNDLRKFDALKNQFEDRRISFIQYGRDFQKAAFRHLNIDLTDPKQQRDFPNLVRIAALAKIEADIQKNSEQLDKERKALRAKLKDFDWNQALPVRHFYENFYGAARKAGIDLSRFPAFKEFAQFSILKSEIDAPAFFREIEFLEEKLYARLAHSPEERDLVKRSQDLRLTEKFVRLEITKEEYVKFSSVKADPAIQVLVQGAGKFYELAQKREEALVSRLLEKARRGKLDKAILVTGGFHASGIEKILKEGQIAYISISPKFSGEDKSGNYLRVIMDKIVAPLLTGEDSSPARRSNVISIARAKAASLGRTSHQEPEDSDDYGDTVSDPYLAERLSDTNPRPTSKAGNPKVVKVTRFTLLRTVKSALRNPDKKIFEVPSSRSDVVALLTKEGLRSGGEQNGVITFFRIAASSLGDSQRVMEGDADKVEVSNLGTVISEPVHQGGTKKLLKFEDIKPGEIAFGQYDKLIPLAVNFLKLYGGSNPQYQSLRPLADILENLTFYVGKVQTPLPGFRHDMKFSVDWEQREVLLDQNFVDFLFRTGRKKITMSWLAGIALMFQNGLGDENQVELYEHTEQVELPLLQILIGGKNSLNGNDTRLNDTYEVFELKTKVALNDTREAPEKVYHLTESDVHLLISDYFHRGRILDAPRLQRILKREFGYYGYFPVEKLQEFLESFYKKNQSRMLRREVISKDDVEGLRKKLADTTEISLADVKSKMTTTVRYSFTREYMSDPAFKDRVTVWDVEVERQDEVNFGGKTAHTGELMFTPRAVTLENFATGSQGFQSLISHNTKEIFVENLAKNRDALRKLIEREKGHLNITADELEESAEKGDEKAKVLIAELSALRVVLDSEGRVTVNGVLEDVLEAYDQLLYDLNDYYDASGIRDYFTQLGASVDQEVNRIKENLAGTEEQLDNVSSRIAGLRKEIETIKASKPEDVSGQAGKEQKLARKEPELEDLLQERKTLEELAQSFQKQFEEITLKNAKRFLYAARNLVVPPALVDEIKQNLKLLAGRLNVSTEELVLAIRSSAVGEDSEEASFAGRQDTYIFVTATNPKIAEAVNRNGLVEVDPSGLDNFITSWVFNQASLFNKRAIDYRFDQGLPTFDNTVEISTLFQRMFLSKLSFIAFSVDRGTGFPSMSMNIHEGQGEMLVSGQESGSKYVVSRDGEVIILREKGERNLKVIETENRIGKQKVRLTPAERAEFSVTDPELIKAAAGYFSAIDDFYDEGYVDLEGAFRPKEGGDFGSRNSHPNGKLLVDPRGFVRQDWNIVSTQARPETVYSLEDPDVIKLKRVVVTDAAYEKAEKEGRVLPFKFIAKTGGAAQGEVAWIMDKTDPDELAKAKGKILATRQSDPDMNSAMISAKGIVAILGGQNSHTMIVASEYGLVAITGTEEQLMQVLKEGTEITIDAERGKILLGYDHEVRVAGQDFSSREVKNTPFDAARSSTIVASKDKALSQHPLRNMPAYKGVGLKRLEIDLAFIEVYTDALLAYDNMIRKEKGGTVTEGDVLDRRKDAELIQFIESKIAGYNSGQDFYETVIREGILAAAEPLNPDYSEAAFRYQQIKDKNLRLTVKNIVNQIYKQGLGHNSDPLLVSLRILRAAQPQGSENIRLIEEIIGLLDKRLYIRLDDRKSDEYKNVKGAEKFVKEELNPMKGFRGLDLLLKSPTLAWQLRVMIDVAKLHRHKIAVFAPIVRRPGDFRRLIQEFLKVGEEMGLSNAELAQLVEIGMMTEIPTNSVYLEDYLDVVEEFRDGGVPIRFFTSTGGNDGLQTVYRIDRNTGDESLKNNANAYSPAVLRWNARIPSQAKKFNEQMLARMNEEIASGNQQEAFQYMIQLVESGYCGNDPSVRRQEEYARGLSELGYKSVSVIIEAFNKVANNLAVNDLNELKLSEGDSVQDAVRRFNLFKAAKDFDFEILPGAAPGRQDYIQINIGDILLDLGVHYHLLADFDNGKLNVEEPAAKLNSEKANLEKSIKELENRIDYVKNEIQGLTQLKEDTYSKASRDEFEKNIKDRRKKISQIGVLLQTAKTSLAKVSYDLETIDLGVKLGQLLASKGYDPEESGAGLKYFDMELGKVLSGKFEEARKTGKKLVIGTDDAPSSSFIEGDEKKGGMRGLIGGHRYEVSEANPDYGMRGLVKNVAKHKRAFKQELRIIDTLRKLFPEVKTAVALKLVRTYTDINEALAVMKDAGVVKSISLFETPSREGFRQVLKKLEEARLVNFIADNGRTGYDTALRRLEKRNMIRGENRGISEDRKKQILSAMLVALKEREDEENKKGARIISTKDKIDIDKIFNFIKEQGYDSGEADPSDIELGLDVQVAANLYELPEILDLARRIAFISLPNAEGFAGEMLAQEQGNINGNAITPEDVRYQTSKPIQILATAALIRQLPFTMPASELAKTEFAYASSLGKINFGLPEQEEARAQELWKKVQLAGAEKGPQEALSVIMELKRMWTNPDDIPLRLLVEEAKLFAELNGADNLSQANRIFTKVIDVAKARGESEIDNLTSAYIGRSLVFKRTGALEFSKMDLADALKAEASKASSLGEKEFVLRQQNLYAPSIAEGSRFTAEDKDGLRERVMEIQERFRAEFEGAETGAGRRHLKDALRGWTIPWMDVDWLVDMIFPRPLDAKEWSFERSHAVREVIDVAEKVRAEKTKVWVNIGIGGSDLPAQALIQATLPNAFQNQIGYQEATGAPEVHFVGNDFSPEKLIDLLEMLNTRGLLFKTKFNAVSKSGTTQEPLAAFLIIRKYLQDRLQDYRNLLSDEDNPDTHLRELGLKEGDIVPITLEDGSKYFRTGRFFIATTGLNDKSELFNLNSKTYGAMNERDPFFALLPVPDGTGGRFSAFSPVGLLALAVTANAEKGETPRSRIWEALEGVKEAIHDMLNIPATDASNIVFQAAMNHFIAETKKGKTVIYFVTYDPLMEHVGALAQQLFSESLTKGGQGFEIVSIVGSNKMHSIWNGIIEGTGAKRALVIFLGTDKTDSARDPKVPAGSGIQGKEVSSMEGLPMSVIQSASREGVAANATASGVLNYSLMIPGRSVRNVARLIYTIQSIVAAEGELRGLGINTYLQGGVQGYKTATAERLGEEKKKLADGTSGAASLGDSYREPIAVMPDNTKISFIHDIQGLPEAARPYWDDHFGVFVIQNEEIGYTAYASVHRASYLNGKVRTIGGTRIRNYASEEEAMIDGLRLSRAMSYKTAGADLPIGGSKIDINVPFDPREANLTPETRAKKDTVLASVAEALEKIGMFATGQDMNVSEANARLMFLIAPNQIQPYSTPGSVEPTPPTAQGVVYAIKAAISILDGKEPADYQGRKAALQGLGGVGSLMLKKLLADGFTVYATDALGKARDRIKQEYQAAIASGQLVILDNPDAIYDVPAEIFSPSAVENTIYPEAIARLKKAGVKAIAGSANNPLKSKDSDAALLHQEGILYVPDYLANAGGLIGVARGIFMGLANQYEVEAKVRSIRENTRRILEQAISEKVSPVVIAERENQEKIDKLSALKRETYLDKVRTMNYARNIWASLKRIEEKHTKIGEGEKPVLPFATLDDVNVAGKTVLVRPDINVPAENGQIKNPDKPHARVIEAAKTIRELAEKGAKVVVIYHQGRPGEPDFIETPDQHARMLEKLIGRKVKPVNDLFGRDAVREIAQLLPGEVVVLKNVRSRDSESVKGDVLEKNPLFIPTLEPLADYFVLDGFSVAHRDSPSVTGFKNIPAVAGRLMQREYWGASNLLNPAQPHLVIIGGAKIPEKFEEFKSALESGRAAKILLGGRIGNLAFAADFIAFVEGGVIPANKAELHTLIRNLLGKDTAENLIQDKDNPLQFLPKMVELLKAHPGKVEVPKDFAWISADGTKQVVLPVGFVRPEGFSSLISGIGPETARRYQEIARKKFASAFIVGPLSDTRYPVLLDETRLVLDAVASEVPFWATGGGDTEDMVKNLGLTSSYSSLAGGALAEFNAGKKLPGVQLLIDRRPSTASSLGQEGISQQPQDDQKSEKGGKQYKRWFAGAAVLLAGIGLGVIYFVKDSKIADQKQEQMPEQPKKELPPAQDKNDIAQTVKTFLSVLLSETDSQKHQSAMMEIVKIGKPAVPALVEALEIKRKEYKGIHEPQNIKFCENIAVILGEIGDTSAVPALISELESPLSIDKSYAAIALGKIGDERAVPALIAAVHSASGFLVGGEISSWAQGERASVFYDAQDALLKIGKPAVPALIRVLNHYDHHSRYWQRQTISAYAAELLIRIGKPAVHDLIEALKSPDWIIRQRAAIILGEIGDTSVVPALIEVLSDSDVRVRESASIALGKMKDERAIPGLLNALMNFSHEGHAHIGPGTSGFMSDSTLYWLNSDFITPDSAEAVKSTVYQGDRPFQGIEIALGKIGKSAIPGLIDALKQNDMRIGRSALAALGNMKDPEAIREMMRILKDKNSDVRHQMAIALGMTGSLEAVFPLIEVLKEDNYIIRKNAVIALGNIGDERAIPSLIEALEDQSWEVRKGAATVLGQLRNPQATSALVKLLNDQMGDIGREAVIALGEIRDSSAVPELIKILEDQTKQGLHYETIIALGKIADERSKLALRAVLLRPYDKLLHEAAEAALLAMGDLPLSRFSERLKSTSDFDRQAAVRVLGEMRNRTVVPELIKLLKDKDSFVRQLTVEALGKIGDERAISELLESWKSDSGGFVREKSAQVLVEIYDERLIPVWIDSLQSNNDVLRENAKRMLVAHINDAPVLSALIEASKNQDIRVRKSALEIIVGSGNIETLPVLINVLSHPGNNVWIYRDVMDAIAKMNDPRVLPALIEASGNYYWRVRLEVAMLLRKINDASASQALLDMTKKDFGNENLQIAALLIEKDDSRSIPSLIQASKNIDWKIRVQAVAALGKIKDARVISALIEALGDRDSWKVRREALWALKAYKDERIGPELRLVLRDSNWRVRREAISALEKTGDQSAISELSEIASTDFHLENRRNATVVLGKMGDQAAIVRLVRQLDGPWNMGRWYGKWDLMKIGPGTVSFLLDFLKRRDLSTVEVLERFGPDSSADLILELRNTDSWIREWAAILLKEIADPRALESLKAAREIEVNLRAKNEMNKAILAIESQTRMNKKSGGKSLGDEEYDESALTIDWPRTKIFLSVVLRIDGDKIPDALRDEVVTLFRSYHEPFDSNVRDMILELHRLLRDVLAFRVIQSGKHYIDQTTGAKYSSEEMRALKNLVNSILHQRMGEWMVRKHDRVLRRTSDVLGGLRLVAVRGNKVNPEIKTVREWSSIPGELNGFMDRVFRSLITQIKPYTEKFGLPVGMYVRTGGGKKIEKQPVRTEYGFFLADGTWLPVCEVVDTKASKLHLITSVRFKVAEEKPGKMKWARQVQNLLISTSESQTLRTIRVLEGGKKDSPKPESKGASLGKSIAKLPFFSIDSRSGKVEQTTLAEGEIPPGYWPEYTGLLSRGETPAGFFVLKAFTGWYFGMFLASGSLVPVDRIREYIGNGVLVYYHRRGTKLSSGPGTGRKKSLTKRAVELGKSPQLNGWSLASSLGSEDEESALKIDRRPSTGASLGVLDGLVDDQEQALIDEMVAAGKLSPVDLGYLAGLLNQLRKPDPNKKQLKIGENFSPSSMLSRGERLTDFGRIDYGMLAADPENAKAAAKVEITELPMDAGLGTSVERLKYITETLLVPDAKIGAKGTDLMFDVNIGGQKVRVSIAEAKLLRALAERREYGRVIYQPLVNEESIESYRQLLDSIYLLDRINASGRKRTYRQVAEEMGVGFAEMVIQPKIPTIDKASGKLTKERVAPGGHGHLGVILLGRALNKNLPNDGNVRVNAFFNGDGVSNAPDTTIVGWMARNQVPIVMISTEKSGIDKKGGMIGLETLPNGAKRAQMMELAQAKKADQEKLFQETGLPGGRGEAGQQDFNTNVALINETVLSPILQELAAIIGEAELFRAMSPDLIQNDKEQKGKWFTQIEGAIGSALLNLNAYFETTQDERVKNILKKRGIEKLLRVVYIPLAERSRFFTPVKTSFDFWLQNYSDYYQFNTDEWRLQDSEAGLTPPIIDLKDPYYNEVQNLIDAFGRASARRLKSLTIEGVVSIRNAVLLGNVKIVNKTGRPVDLTEEKYLKQMPHSAGKLYLPGSTLTIEADGTLIASSLGSETFEDIFGTEEEFESPPDVELIVDTISDTDFVAQSMALARTVRKLLTEKNKEGFIGLKVTRPEGFNRLKSLLTADRTRAAITGIQSDGKVFFVIRAKHSDLDSVILNAAEKLDVILPLEGLSETSTGESLGTVIKISGILAGQERSIGNVLGTARQLSGRIIGNEEAGVREFLLGNLFISRLTAAEDAKAALTQAAHAKYVSALNDGLYREAYGPEAEFAVLAATSNRVSIAALKRQLESNPLALALVAVTDAGRKTKMIEELGLLAGRVILVDASKVGAAAALEQALASEELWKKARPLYSGDFNATVLARHTTIFADAAVLEQIKSFGLASRLVAGDKEGLLEKQLESFNVSPDEFNLYGNSIAYLIARKGGFDKLSREWKSSLKKDVNSSWIYIEDLTGLKAIVSRLAEDLAGFLAVSKAA